MLTSKEIRRKYLEFFRSKGHEVVASAPIVIKNDPTLMFTNAGMNQFKDLFLGNAPVKFPRIADTQKCLRVSGKHNDLEEVGHDTYHHTMFEMLGNWSFGDYFKEDAIAWAYELLIQEYKLDLDRMYVTVFGGDAGDGLEVDNDARNIWKKYLPAERILDGSKKDNFWEMGDTGPCGPCSEIHFDLRSDEERAAVPGADLVNKDHPRVMEVWNLVFMEFNRKADGSLEKLPAQHVDTGMGFERLCMVVQGKESNYDSDVFSPIIRRIEELTGFKKDVENAKDIAMRVVADHIRAVSFAIADGQIPSNTGAGYVIRRILRRATRYAYSYLNMDVPFMYQLVDVLAAEMGEFFPEISSQKQLVKSVVLEEETAFLRTLEQGLKRLDEILKTTSGAVVDGAKAFELYDTFGFPADLTSLILRENGKTMDEEGFNREMQAQKERSRAATAMEAGDWQVVIKDSREEFVGYDYLTSTVHVAKYRKVATAKKEFYQVVLDHTPFYPEGGGQVGDKGVLSDGATDYEVFDTKKENGQIIHFTNELPPLDKALKACVSEELRQASANNHSATHLLHQALREILGTHVEQKGSLVSPEHLRFDFSHFQKLSDEEIRAIEHYVNRRIRENHDLQEHRNVAMEDALAMGAIALFGEKYGDTVRAIQFGDSIELCGGTHVKATGRIGYFKILSEGAVAAGVRRIEAITSEAAENWVEDQIKSLKEVMLAVKNADPVSSIKALKEENAALQRQVEILMREKAGNLSGDLIASAEVIGDAKFIAKKVEIDAAATKDLCFKLKSEEPMAMIVLAVESEGKVQLHLAIGDDLVSSKGLNAGTIVREIAKHVQGGGGGQPFYATAGGKNPQGITAAFEAAKTYLK